MSDNGETKPLKDYDEQSLITTHNFEISIENFNEAFSQSLDNFLDIAENTDDNVTLTLENIYTELFKLVQLGIRMYEKNGIDINNYAVKYELPNILNDEDMREIYLMAVSDFFKHAAYNQVIKMSSFDYSQLSKVLSYLSRNTQKSANENFYSFKVLESNSIFARGGFTSALLSADTNLDELVLPLSLLALNIVDLAFATVEDIDMSLANSILNDFTWFGKSSIESSATPHIQVINAIKALATLDKSIPYKSKAGYDGVLPLSAVLNAVVYSIIKSRVTTIHERFSLDLSNVQEEIELILSFSPEFIPQEDATQEMKVAEDDSRYATDEVKQVVLSDGDSDGQATKQISDKDLIGIYEFADFEEQRIGLINSILECFNINEIPQLFTLTRQLLEVERYFDAHVMDYHKQIVEYEAMLNNPEEEIPDLEHFKYKLVVSLSSTINLYQHYNRLELATEVSKILNLLME